MGFINKCLLLEAQNHCYFYNINVLCIAKLTADGVTSAGCYLVSHVLVVWLNMKEQKNSELWEVFLCAIAHGQV